MEQVGEAKLWSFLEGAKEAALTSNSKVRRDPGFAVTNYLDLAGRVAELQYRNRNHVLFFRGQGGDWKNVRKATSLKPTIFRGLPSLVSRAEPIIQQRYQTLLQAEELLAKGFNGPIARFGRQRVDRERMLRWSILQHYEVCPTPLLDVTHSLRIAASFASVSGSAEAFLYVLAVPNLSGAVTANAEGGLQVVRLASVCPPVAIRPHIQEGYLLGEYPEMIGPDQTKLYEPYEMDFGRRIVGKFRFKPAHFWSDPSFPQVPQEALYPKGRDWLEQLTADIAAKVKP